MAESLNFVVRPLDCKNLDGAFRVHLPVEALEQLNFTLGDICEVNEGGNVRGYGIAWRAADRMGNGPKVRPAKISDYLKNVLDVKDGSHVTISKSSGQILLAAKITLDDITPTEYGQTGDHPSEDNKWVYRCATELVEREAFAVGTKFDVHVKKGLRRRFCISNIESEDPSQRSDAAPDLHCFGKHTAITISAGTEQSQDSSEVFGSRLLVTAEKVGGLVDQLRTLNEQMFAMLKRTHCAGKASRRRSNKAILVHGYEGTGKSLILDELEAAGFRKVSRITPLMLTGSAVTKNKALIKASFDAARTNQPSLILLDNLQKLAPKSDDTYAQVLLHEIKTLADTQVLVVGACRSPRDLNSELLDEGCFPVKIELPTPDLHARREILDVLLKDEPAGDPQVRESLAFRTHGFTGRDLMELYDAACRNLDVRRIRALSVSSNNHLDGKNGEGGSETIRKTAADGTALGTHGEIEDGNEEAPTQDDWNVALKEVGPSALREITFEKPEVQWSDIGGSEVMKKRFDEIIGWPIHYPELSKAHGVVPKKGILLYGPPGCSKTLTAQAVASTYDLNFIAVQGAELISMYVGESERSIREIFRKARAAAPCVVFFDEIDSIASERDSGTKGLNVLTTLLNEMDGFKVMSDVLVLAATNKPQALDPAIMRPGRFDSHVYLGPPSAEARREIFVLSTRGLAVGDDVDFDELVIKTEGYTGAEVVQICNHAKEDSLRRDIAANGTLKHLRMVDVLQAIERTPHSVDKSMLDAYDKFGQPSQRA